jgi:phage shock protein C
MAMSDKKLTRSMDDRMIAGVASGLADYFNTDPALIRILFVLLTLLGGGFIGILTYIVLWIVMPLPADSMP